MASVPLRSTRVEAAPKDYSIPAAQLIRLLSVRASFDGSGAASPWLPALQILDNNGNVLVTAADPNVSVAAAGSADVSWFPGVKPASTASGSSTFSAYAELSLTGADTPLSVPGGGTSQVPWPHATWNDTTVFGTSLNGTPTTVHDTAGDQNLVLRKNGVYFFFFKFLFENTVGSYQRFGYINNADLVSGVGEFMDSFKAQSGDGYGHMGVNIAIQAVTSAPSYVQPTVQQLDGVARNLIQAYLAAYYFPVDPAATGGGF